MTEIIRLGAHDPVPDYGNHGLVLRRMGEDDPRAVVTEIIFKGSDGGSRLALGPDGAVLPLDQAVHLARQEAARRGVPTLYVVDRTAGHLEREALAHAGSHNFTGTLSDSDAVDGVRGSDMRDRPNR